MPSWLRGIHGRPRRTFKEPTQAAQQVLWQAGIWYRPVAVGRGAVFGSAVAFVCSVSSIAHEFDL
jgi:hypothetical protein